MRAGHPGAPAERAVGGGALRGGSTGLLRGEGATRAPIVEGIEKPLDEAGMRTYIETEALHERKRRSLCSGKYWSPLISHNLRVK
jgi:hypothetical protein